MCGAELTSRNIRDWSQAMGIAAYSPMTISIFATEWLGDVGSTHLRM
jgi:hypothetical protein